MNESKYMLLTSSKKKNETSRVSWSVTRFLGSIFPLIYFRFLDFRGFFGDNNLVTYFIFTRKCLGHVNFPKMYLLTYSSYLNGSGSMQMKVLIQERQVIQHNLLEIWIPLYQIKISDEIKHTSTWHSRNNSLNQSRFQPYQELSY